MNSKKILKRYGCYFVGDKTRHEKLVLTHNGKIFSDLATCKRNPDRYGKRNIKASRSERIMKYVYPAIFDYDEAEHAYNVSFPDVSGCLTCGYDKFEAIDMAGDALNLMLWYNEREGREISAASKLEDITPPKNGFIQYVLADTERYDKYVMQPLQRKKQRQRKAAVLSKKSDIHVRSQGCKKCDKIIMQAAGTISADKKTHE